GLDRQSIEYRFTGLRPGEKLFEQMTWDEETLTASSVSGLREVLHSPRPTRQQLAAALKEIDAACDMRDLVRLLQAITSLIPGYVPSACLQKQIKDQALERTTV
ncbi:MAG TPA: polysaccharide biosynthesis protein, partial [Acidobacteriaceae bacterium]|nr:polysaccharide biosynthesis protein [Acidobacteriaceae bacterium]